MLCVFVSECVSISEGMFTISKSFNKYRPYYFIACINTYKIFKNKLESRIKNDYTALCSNIVKDRENPILLSEIYANLVVRKKSLVEYI